MALVRALFRHGRLIRAGIAGLAALAVVLGAAGAAAPLTTQSSRLPRASHLRLPVAYNGMDGWSGGRARPALLYVGGPDTCASSASTFSPSCSQRYAEVKMTGMKHTAATAHSAAVASSWSAIALSGPPGWYV